MVQFVNIYIYLKLRHKKCILSPKIKDLRLQSNQTWKNQSDEEYSTNKPDRSFVFEEYRPLF
jgi:hypothetical protein